MNQESKPADKRIELLPCPFCSSQPEWINEALPDSHFYIRCPHCHIVMKEDRRDKVIGMWNSRSERNRMDEELKEAVRVITRLCESYENSGFEKYEPYYTAKEFLEKLKL